MVKKAKSSARKSTQSSKKPLSKEKMKKISGGARAYGAQTGGETSGYAKR